MPLYVNEIIAAANAGDQSRLAALARAQLQSVSHPAVLRQAMPVGNHGAVVDDQVVWQRYGALLARQGLLTEAREALDISLALKPDCHQSLLDAATAAFMQGDLAIAEGYFTRALAIDPNRVATHSALAAIAARKGASHAAREAAQRALALSPGDVTATLALIRADLLDTNLAEADSHATMLLKRNDLNAQNRVAAFDLRAEVRDAQDRPDDAYDDYSARNKQLIAMHAKQFNQPGVERKIDQAERLAAYFTTTSNEAWQRPSPSVVPSADVPRTHAFLVGFPRSGTTLLEKALAGHDAIVALEEIESLRDISDRQMQSTAALDALPMLNNEQKDSFCQTYWQRVRAAAGGEIAGKTVIDKMPIYTVHLPVIATLFPNARIIFAVRDPRDVVLSCFRRRFAMNATMFELLTLDGCARYYDAVMRIATGCRAVLPLEFQDVRLESVITNFDREIEAVLSFLDLGWDSGTRDFATRASSGRATPSDAQLRTGLNAQGVGQWRRYAPSLASVLPTLSAWAEHYGYDPL
jgi:tetratricopeptide (TPR) repeat protein